MFPSGILCVQRLPHNNVMSGTVVLLLLLVTCLGIKADPVADVSQDKKSQQPDSVAAIFSRMRPVREGELLMLQDQVQKGDTLLKERQQEDYADLKEMLKEGDIRLKQRFVAGVATLKEQLEEGDSQLKEELAEDTAWLKDKLNKIETRMKEEMAEGEEKMKEELQDLKDAFQNLQTAMKEWTQSHGQIVLGSLDSSEDRDSYTNIGSTFVRWGRRACPDNTSLVYSGVVGGSFFTQQGGASNYLCLVMDPQLDNMTAPKGNTGLYGTEYQYVEGQHEQDAVCSVCRTSLATTIMVPATLTCPLGWTTQYQGHLMADHHETKRGTEYICVDLIKEYRNGGHEHKNGALLYHVVVQCGSLPCPPYVNNKVVTCVVCSA